MKRLLCESVGWKCIKKSSSLRSCGPDGGTRGGWLWEERESLASGWLASVHSTYEGMYGGRVPGLRYGIHADVGYRYVWRPQGPAGTQLPTLMTLRAAECGALAA